MKRRDFLQRACSLAAGGIVPRSIWWPVTPQTLEGPAGTNNRVLVLIIQSGGNDGLNTLIPHADPLYYQLRPTLAIPQAQILNLNSQVGLHPGLNPLLPLWNQGKLAVVRDVGYPNMNLSHFRASDIVFSGSSAEQNVQSGWLARWLEATHPQFPGILPEHPLAVQQGLSAGLLLQGDRGVTGVSVWDPDSFFWLVNSTYAGPYTDAVPSTHGGSNLSFLRGVEASGYDYANVIHSAALTGQNTGTYPDTYLGAQLATIARLIDGQLNTPVYITGHDGFDTHTGQPGSHPQLLAEWAEAVSVFLADIASMGRQDDVLVLTVSEFGRRVEENGDAGTDHGTAAPWFLAGGGLNGGLYGGPSHLDQLDGDGNLQMQHDYRSVYSTILQSWMGVSGSQAATILKGTFPVLPFLAAPTGVAEEEGAAESGLSLLAPTPNPGRGPRTVRFRLAESGPVELRVFDVTGRTVATLKEGVLSAGAHEIVWEARDVAAGVYMLVLSAGREQRRRKLIVHS